MCVQQGQSWSQSGQWTLGKERPCFLLLRVFHFHIRSRELLGGLAEVGSPDCRLCDPGLLDYVLDQLDQNRHLGNQLLLTGGQPISIRIIDPMCQRSVLGYAGGSCVWTRWRLFWLA